MRTIDVVAAIIGYEDKYLCTKRGKGGPVAFKWEFPGGKIEENESHENALIREIREELSMSIEPLEHFMTVQHSYSEFRVNLHAYLCKAQTMDFNLNVHEDAKWLQAEELISLDWAIIDKGIVEMLISIE